MATLALAAWKFFLLRRDKIKREEFEIYHEKIKELVEPQGKDTPIYLDRQIAIIFELRHFKRYYPVSHRILKGLLKDWENGEERLRSEIMHTISYIENHVKKREMA